MYVAHLKADRSSFVHGKRLRQILLDLIKGLLLDDGGMATGRSPDEGDIHTRIGQHTFDSQFGLDTQIYLRLEEEVQSSLHIGQALIGLDAGQYDAPIVDIRHINRASLTEDGRQIVGEAIDECSPLREVHRDGEGTLEELSQDDVLSFLVLDTEACLEVEDLRSYGYTEGIIPVPFIGTYIEAVHRAGISLFVSTISPASQGLAVVAHA